MLDMTEADMCYVPEARGKHLESHGAGTLQNIMARTESSGDPDRYRLLLHVWLLPATSFLHANSLDLRHSVRYPDRDVWEQHPGGNVCLHIELYDLHRM